jgi:hypothetical protein
VTDTQQGYKRSWLAIGLGTMVIVVSYSSILIAIVAARSDTPEAASPAFALGLALVPIVFVTVAFISGRRAAPIAVLKALGLWLLVALPLGIFNPVFGLCAAFGIGGVVTLKENETASWIIRTVAVILVAAYSLLMVFIIPALGLLSGGLLPLAALGIADYYTRNRGTKPG